MAVSTRTAGPEYFSPMSDVKTPAMAIPPCHHCGKPSLGGCMETMEESSPVGRPIFTAVFYCGDHNPSTFALMSNRLYPVYRVLEMKTPSRLKVQRLDRGQQEARLKNG